MDDSQFLGSMMGDATVLAQPAPAPPGTPPAPPPAPATGQQVVVPPALVGVKKKRGRPPRNRDAATAARKEEDEDEVVCFICFDGGDLVVCDRRGCPKVYHPACVKRDEAFFQGRSKWNCSWHICSSCEKAVHYMCYTCTFSVCKVCIKHGKFFGVRGTKGFCDTCFGTILLVEAKDDADTKLVVDMDAMERGERGPLLPESHGPKIQEDSLQVPLLKHKKRGGSKALAVILGFECLESTAFNGISTNLVVYLETVLHGSNVSHGDGF